MARQRIIGNALFLGLSASLLWAESSHASQLYTITNLGTGLVMGINSQGEVLGNDSVGSYLFANGQKQYLPQSAGGSFYGRALNDLGQVAGFVNFGSGYNYDLATYANGSLTVRTDLPGLYPSGFNSNGEIVGLLVFQYQGFLYSNNAVTQIGAFPNAVNATGTVVGTTGGSNSRAFVYQDGQISYLTPPAAVSAEASAINNSREIVGNLSTQTGLLPSQVFIYQNGQYQEFGPALHLPSEADAANAVNDSGTIVGVAQTSFGLFGWSYNPVTGFGNLNSGIAAPGWQLQAATGINDSGDIIGMGQFNGQADAFLLTPLAAPEPAEWSLTLTGCLWMALRWRRKTATTVS